MMSNTAPRFALLKKCCHLNTQKKKPFQIKSIDNKTEMKPMMKSKRRLKQVKYQIFYVPSAEHAQ